MEFVAVDRFDQTIKNFTSGDLGIPIVVIRAGVTGLERARVMYQLDLFEGRGRRSSVFKCSWSAFR